MDLPDDVTKGEIVTCPDCGLDFEVYEASSDGISLKRAESIGEDWGE
ncbi:MAG: lysine biosynthesis protein LysW [Nitrososphaerales archaeon]